MSEVIKFSYTFQLQSEHSNFSPNFSTSDLTNQLHSFQFHVGLSNSKLSNFSFFSNCSFQLHVSHFYFEVWNFNKNKCWFLVNKSINDTLIFLWSKLLTNNFWKFYFAATTRKIDLKPKTNCTTWFSKPKTVFLDSLREKIKFSRLLFSQSFSRTWHNNAILRVK